MYAVKRQDRNLILYKSIILNHVNNFGLYWISDFKRVISINLRCKCNSVCRHILLIWLSYVSIVYLYDLVNNFLLSKTLFVCQTDCFLREKKILILIYETQIKVSRKLEENIYRLFDFIINTFIWTGNKKFDSVYVKKNRISRFINVVKTEMSRKKNIRNK
jgi:hypothetical protein